jgi:general stress protein YciG
LGKKALTVAEAGRRGGNRTMQTHGPEFFAEIGRKGGLNKTKSKKQEA